MILHIATDQKFIDTGFRLFEEVSPGMNKLIVITPEDKVNFIKNTPFDKLTENELHSKEFNRYLEGVTAVVFHSLRSLHVNLPSNIKVLWIGFGFDYYNLIYRNQNNLLLSKTIELKKSLNKDGYVKKLLKSIPFSKEINQIIKERSKLKFINKVDFFSPVLNSEYDLVVDAVSNFSPIFIDWNYGTLEDDLLKGFEEKRINGDNILVGNSATYTNNHLEAFELLSLMGIKNKEIICPLSYGSDKYKNEICKIGEDFFGCQFHALTGFMPIEEYINTLSSCSIVIMNHIRQQALGNIIIMLYLGAKVFLKKRKSDLYLLYK